jgi:hypothetical protein
MNAKIVPTLNGKEWIVVVTDGPDKFARHYHYKAEADKVADRINKDPIAFGDYTFFQLQVTAHCNVCGEKFWYSPGLLNTTLGSEYWPKCPKCGSYRETHEDH